MRPLHLGVALAVIATGCQPPAVMAPPTAESYLAGQVLVRFEPETGEAARMALREKYGARDVEALPSGTERWHVSGTARELSGAIARETGVKAAQPNWIRRLQAFTPQDMDYAGSTKKQWHLLKDYLDMAEIWKDTGFTTQTLPGNGITVAVVDSGVDLSHPDLLPSLHKSATGSALYLDEMPEDQHPAPTLDGNGHGTHVAGIIAASPAADGSAYGPSSNQGNVVGVAPGARILAVKVMRRDGGGNDFTIAKGIDNAVAWRHPENSSIRVNVINLSIGGSEPSPTLAASLANATQNGVLVIAAAGNSGSPIMYPAAYPGALAVGALTPRNQRASYSCYGPQLSIVAPGGADPHEPTESLNTWSGIYSTFPTYSNYTNQQYYGAQSGTSMAAPVVTGIAALILSQNKNLTPDQLKMRLVATADDIGTPGFDNQTGWGKINPRRALDWTAHDGVTP